MRVTDKERQEYIQIILELCAKYGIEPFPQLFDNLDEAVARAKKDSRQSSKYARQLAKAMNNHIDKTLLEATK